MKGEGLFGGLALAAVVVVLASLVALRIGCEFDFSWIAGFVH